jgi:hypothetical protein
VGFEDRCANANTTRLTQRTMNATEIGIIPPAQGFTRNVSKRYNGSITLLYGQKIRNHGERTHGSASTLFKGR